MSKDKDHLRMVERTPSNWEALPTIMRQIKDDAITVLVAGLDELFTHCDDLFFDLSSRAASNNEQTLYFESMRELRVKKAAVINGFRQNLEQSFLALGRANGSQAGKPGSIDPLNADTFTLVQNDELEREVALSGMIGKARAANQESIYHLTLRLDYLVARIQVTQDNNPLDPETICRGFANACEQFDIHIKARIIIFKQFERLVLARLVKVYSAANELLINAGVLPKISHQVRKQADVGVDGGSQQASSGTDAGSAMGSAALAGAPAHGFNFDFGELSNLLASMRRLGLTSLPNYNAYTTNPGPLMPATELLELLSHLQASVESQPSGHEPPPDLRQLVQNLLRAADPQQPQSLQQPDEDVINLVAMFFDFVLDDRNLPVAIQALISRLQIPILKVALRDKAFFSHTGHPARRLINTIASASVGWDESDQPSKDKLYDKVLEIVQTINEHYTDNEHVFIEKLAELEQFLQQENQRVALVEKRTSQAAEGQARTRQAKTAVQSLLYGKLEKPLLPAAISEFLVETWQQLLVLIHLRQGEDNPDWIAAAQLVDDLLWACGRHSDARSRQRLEKIKPDLLARIASGLSRIAATAEESQAIVARIDRVLTRLQDGKTDIEFQPLSSAQAIALGHTPGSGSKDWKEMTALERQQARFKALTYDFIRQVEELPLGTWISYEDSRRGKILRCKLAARISVTDSYVFVNRFGFKVLEKSRREFAYDMQQRRASALDSGPLFERAMQGIVSNLRNLGRPEPQPAG